jgi:hypothetical protein
MKGLTAWIAGVALVGSLVVPAFLRANQGEDRQTTTTTRYYPGQTSVELANHEDQPTETTVHTTQYYPAANSEEVTCDPNDVHGASMTYAPAGVMYSTTVDAVPVAEPGMMIAGNRIYYISDDPRYDLSGSNESIYLVNDGTAYHAPAAHTATFAATGGVVPAQVVAVPAEYRQDWLAVAAGDRPVRCIPSVGAVEVETHMTNQMTSEETDHGEVTQAQDANTRYVNRSRPRYVTHHRKSHYKTTNAHIVNREPVENAVVEPAAHGTMVTSVETPPQMGEMYQVHNSWYMMRDGDWLRSDSWRGPFFPVKKGHVPREVRESAKRDHSPETDD